MTKQSTAKQIISQNICDGNVEISSCGTLNLSAWLNKGLPYLINLYLQNPADSFNPSMHCVAHVLIARFAPRACSRIKLI